ncbi:Ephrin type-A receptor 4 [Ceratobasidium sp. AG-Ba]|nr:Ephrin type-A receptor 4 [Ceratobasidium sp. AG-Ba]
MFSKFGVILLGSPDDAPTAIYTPRDWPGAQTIPLAYSMAGEEARGGPGRVEARSNPTQPPKPSGSSGSYTFAGGIIRGTSREESAAGSPLRLSRAASTSDMSDSTMGSIKSAPAKLQGTQHPYPPSYQPRAMGRRNLRSKEGTDDPRSSASNPYPREAARDKSVSMVTSFMTVSEVIACLVDRGCANITNQLDGASYSTFPIYNGGFGDIYQGCLKDGTKVAIKTMRLYVNHNEDRTPLKHAARELYTWSKCRHKNVHHLLGLIEFRGQIGMIAQVAAGLSYLHQNNIVHGDLKACNVLVSEDGTPLLSDFGNATFLEYTLNFTNTSTKTAISVRWAAPEILEGKAMFSVQGDVYALGMTILEIISGNVPWFGKGEPAVALSVFVKKEHPERPLGRVPKDCQYSNALWSLLEACWSYEPSTRPSAIEAERWIQDMESRTATGTTAKPSNAEAMPILEDPLQGVSRRSEASSSISEKPADRVIAPTATSEFASIDHAEHDLPAAMLGPQNPWYDNLLPRLRDEGGGSNIEMRRW